MANELPLYFQMRNRLAKHIREYITIEKWLEGGANSLCQQDLDLRLKHGEISQLDYDLCSWHTFRECEELNRDIKQTES
jgi:hypothetical protein